MTQNQLDRFQNILEAKRAELRRGIGDRRDSLAIERASDPLDQVIEVTERDLAIGDVDIKVDLLRSVDNALRRLDEGTFGACSNCGRKIPLRRLEAVPWTPYCVACQEEAEAGRNGGSSASREPYALAS